MNIFLQMILKQQSFRFQEKSKWLLLLVIQLLFTIGYSQFSSNFQTVCVNQTTNFIPDNLSGTTYLWTFPGGTPATSNLKYPAVSYSTTGTYDVQLSVNGAAAQKITKYIRVIISNDNTSYLSDSKWVYGNNGNTQTQLSSFTESTHTTSILSTSNFTPTGGNSSISNFDGNLLFYTNGATVFNRKNQPMKIHPGITILSISNQRQSSLILPKPGSCGTIYYLITTGASGSGIFAYEINMNQDSGLGRIVTNLGAVTPNSGNFRSITAVPNCANNGYWLVTQEENNLKRVLSVPLTSAGFGTTIYSMPASFPGISGAYFSSIKISPDKKTLAIVWEYHATNPGTGGILVYNFNNGVASSPHTLSIPAPYAGKGFSSSEFSPNSRYLYLTSRVNGNSIVRIDLNSGQPHSSSLYPTGNSMLMGLQGGIDGKIYFQTNLASLLSCIVNPDAANPTLNISGITKLTNWELCFNNGAISRYYSSAQLKSGLPYKAIICNSSLTLTSSYSGGSPTYQWYSGKTGLLVGKTSSSLVVTDADIYFLEITDGGCKSKSMVIVDKMDDHLIPLPTRINISCNNPIQLDGGADFQSYFWSLGTPNNQRYLNLTGNEFAGDSQNVQLTVTLNGCTKTVSIMVSKEACCATPITNAFQATFKTKNSGSSIIKTAPISLFTNTDNSSVVLQRINNSNDFNIIEIDATGHDILNKTYTSSSKFTATASVESVSNPDGKIIIGNDSNRIYISEINPNGTVNTARQKIFSFANSTNYKLEATAIVRSFYDFTTSYGYCILVNKKNLSDQSNEVFLLGVASDFNTYWIRKVNYSGIPNSIFHAHNLLAIQTSGNNTISFIVMATSKVGTSAQGILIDTKVSGWGTSLGSTVIRASNNVYFNGSIIHDNAWVPKNLIFTGSTDASGFTENSSLSVLRTTMNLAATSLAKEKKIPNYRMAGLGIIETGYSGNTMLLIESKPLSNITGVGHFYHNLELDSNLNIVNSNKMVTILKYTSLDDHNEYLASKTLFNSNAEGGFTILGADSDAFFINKTDNQLNGSCVTNSTILVKTNTSQSITSGTTSASTIGVANFTLTPNISSSLKICCNVKTDYPFTPCNYFHAADYNFNYTVNKTEAIEGDTFVFTITGQYDMADIDYFEWNFGDGVNVNTTNNTISHIFPIEGVSVTWTTGLIIHFKNGCTKSKSNTVTTNPCQTIYQEVTVPGPCNISVPIVNFFSNLLANGYNGWSPNCPNGSGVWTDEMGNIVSYVGPLLGSVTYKFTCTDQFGCKTISNVTFTPQNTTQTIAINLAICEPPFCMMLDILNDPRIPTCPGFTNLVSIDKISFPGASYAPGVTMIQVCRGDTIRIRYQNENGCICTIIIRVKCELDPGPGPLPETGGGNIPTIGNKNTTQASNPNIQGVNANTSLSNISIYPNPSDGTYSFEYNSPERFDSKYTIEVYDLRGSLVYSSENYEPNHKYIIDLGFLASGVYNCKFIMPGSVQVIKLMKK